MKRHYKVNKSSNMHSELVQKLILCFGQFSQTFEMMFLDISAKYGPNKEFYGTKSKLANCKSRTIPISCCTLLNSNGSNLCNSSFFFKSQSSHPLS